MKLLNKMLNLYHPKSRCCWCLILILVICWIFQVKYMEIIFIIIAVLIYYILDDKEHFSACNLAAPNYYGAILDPSNDEVRFSYGQTYDEDTIRGMSDEEIDALAKENVNQMLKNMDPETLYYSQYGTGYLTDFDETVDLDYISPEQMQLLEEEAQGDRQKLKELIQQFKDDKLNEGDTSARKLAKTSLVEKEKIN